MIPGVIVLPDASKMPGRAFSSRRSADGGESRASTFPLRMVMERAHWRLESPVQILAFLICNTVVISGYTLGDASQIGPERYCCE